MASFFGVQNSRVHFLRASLVSMTDRTREEISDLLVHGYVRDHERILNLTSVIPTEIYLVILAYELLTASWNKELSHHEWNIDKHGSTATIHHTSISVTDNTVRRTIYGTHIIKHGEEFTWKLTIKHGENVNLIVGLILNEPDLLERYKTDISWFQTGGFAYGSLSGVIAYNGRTHSYSDRNLFCKTNDELVMIFNWKKKSLHFIINGSDLGNALKDYNGKLLEDEAQAKAFRFAACVFLSDLTSKHLSLTIE